MNNIKILITFLSLSAICTIIAETLGKKWTTDNKLIYFILGLALIVVSGTFFILSLKYGKLGVIAVAWDAMTSFFLILIGYFIFKEALTITQIIAAILIFSGMFLLLK